MMDFTTASDDELKRAWTAIAREMGDDRFLTAKELSHLPKILDPQEQVLAFSSGFMQGNTWLIALTDRRVLFVDKGMIYGLKQISIFLSQVNTVQGTTGLLFGTLTITDGSSSYKIENVWKKTVVPFSNKVRAAVDALRLGRPLMSPAAAPEPAPAPEHAPSTPPPPLPPATASPRAHGAVLARLERLRNAGSLTDAEYSDAVSRIPA